MNIEIVSASKKAESVFDAPLSTTVLEANEIDNSGATSIPELLRLIPGIIVREKTNGNYDVHIRGNDNVKKGVVSSINTKTLVMIDNRIVYNYFQGGTFWETLPVSVNDIERIELIRGPSSALYGPNAVTGVINIITKNAEENNKVSATANLQAGNLNSKIASVAVGYGSDKFGVRASGNYTYKERFQEEYYIFDVDRYAERDSMWLFTTPGHGGPVPIIDSEEVMERYPDVNRGVDNYGVNVSAYYDVNEKVKFDLSVGMQESKAQTLHLGQKISPMNNRLSNSKYVNLNSQVYGFSSTISYMQGVQDIVLGAAGWKYDMNVIDAIVEYNYEIKGLTIRPGISFQNATYNDLPHIDTSNGEGFIKAKQTLSNVAPLLRAEYTFFEKLRLIAAVRYDKYNSSDNGYLGYQFATTYKLNDKNLLRFVASRSNTSPTIYGTYQNFSIPLFANLEFTIKGNGQIKPEQMDMYELGFRSKLKGNLIADVEVFYSSLTSLSNFELVEMQDPPMSFLPKTSLNSNIDLAAKQTGATVNISYIHSEKLQLKAFGTFQQTTLTDFTSSETMADTSYTHKYTPAFYGGFSINASPINKLNIFANMYFYGKQEYTQATIEVPAKVILNTKISYNVWKNNSVFVNVRNVLNNKNKEFIHADDNGMLFLVGLDIKF